MTKPSSLDSQSEEVLRRKIADGSQNPDDYRNLAELQLATGRGEEAISLLKAALDLPLTNYQRAEISMELGWNYYEMGRRAHAELLAQSALGLLSQEPESADVLSCRGSSQSLLAHCLWFTDVDVGAEAARLALKWLEQVMAKAPEFEEIAAVYCDAARLQNLLGNAEEAISLCEECLQHKLNERERLSCLMAYIEALRLARRFREAEHTLEEAFRYTEANKGILPLLYFTLGLIQRSTNRVDEARETFQKTLEALQADADLRDESDFFPQVYWNLGELCYGSEEYNKALEAFQKILVYHPEDDLDRCSALLWLGRCCLAIEAHTKAREFFEQVLASSHSSESDKVSAREGLGEVYYNFEEYEEAALTFEEVLDHEPEDNPDRWNTLLWLGNSYEGTGAHDKARDCFEQVLASPHASETDKASAHFTRTSYESPVKNRARVIGRSDEPNTERALLFQAFGCPG
jgi:tetratricopeptide (TPR) repeat protein